MQRSSPRLGRFDFDVITDPIEPRPAPRVPKESASGSPAVAPVRGASKDAAEPTA